MKKIVIIAGSLRKNSFNVRLAHVIADQLEGRAEVSLLNYADVPNMNQDVEFPAPAEVARVRAEVRDADGVWVVTPEYNSSYPGALKNLLDWLRRPLAQDGPDRSSAVTGKRATVSGAAGRSGAAGARGKMTELLATMRMDVMREPQVGIALGVQAFATDEFVLSDSDRSAVAQQVEAFLAFLEA